MRRDLKTGTRPLRCHAQYRPSVERRTVFGSRIHNGLLLRHEGDDIYLFLKDSDTVLTKNVRFQEREVPLMYGIGLWLQYHDVPDSEAYLKV